MTTVWDINLFYPLIFLAIIVLTATVGLVIKGSKSDTTFKDIFFKHDDNNKAIFDKHVEEHIDTTDKFKDVTMGALGRTAVDVEQEFHSLHVDIKETNKRMLVLIEEINDKVDILTTRVVQLEREKQN